MKSNTGSDNDFVNNPVFKIEVPAGYRIDKLENTLNAFNEYYEELGQATTEQQAVDVYWRRVLKPRLEAAVRILQTALDLPPQGIDEMLGTKVFSDKLREIMDPIDRLVFAKRHNNFEQ